MADEAAIKRAALLRHFLGLLSKDKDASLEAGGACREACHALTAQQLLKETQLLHASSHARGQLAQSVEAWCSSLSKLLQKAHPSPLVVLLLGSTIQTCDADRLLQLHGSWGTALADVLKKCSSSLLPQGAATPQPSGATALVVAVASALRHLFTRLHDFLEVGGIRRDASALASRAAGIATPMLAGAMQPHAHISGPVCIALLRLVTTLLRALPTALRHHAPGLEQALAAIVAAPNHSSSSSSANHSSGWSKSGGSGGKNGGRGGSNKGSMAELRERAARCMCLLPRAQGDAHSHSNTFRRLLLSLHDAMDGAFMGLDDPTAAAAARENLGGRGTSSSGGVIVASGSSSKGAAADAAAAGPLIPCALLLHGSSANANTLPAAAVAGSGSGLGGGGGGSNTASGDAVRRLLEVVGALLVGVEVLLVEPFPVLVPLPSTALLSALSRLLSFNEGARLAAGRVPPSASGFARLSAGLPSLQATGWELLGLMLRVCGCSLLPLLPTIARVLADVLHRVYVLGPAGLAAHPPAVRAAVYRAARAACEARGVGAVRLLGDACMGAISVELYGWAVQAEGGARSHAYHVGGVGGRSGGSSKHAAKRAKLMGAAEAVESAEAEAAAAAAAAGASTCMAAGSDELEAQLAAVQLMEALASAGGPLLYVTTRAQVDAMSFHVAAAATAAAHRLALGHPRTAATAASATTATAADAAPGLNSQQGASAKSGAAAAAAAAASGSAVPASVTAGLASLRAAALRALLATLLAPCSPASRPPFLSQALQLFREGAAGGAAAAHPEVTEVCRGAGAQLEALLHPRALPISVAQPSAYAGLQELAPLPRLRMWTVLDPTPALTPRTPGPSNGPLPLGHTPTAHLSSQPAAAGTGGGAAAGAGLPSTDAHGRQGPQSPTGGQALRGMPAQSQPQEQPGSLATTEAFKHAKGSLSGAGSGGAQGVDTTEGVALGSAGNAEGERRGNERDGLVGGGKKGRSSTKGGSGRKDTGDVCMGEADHLQQQPQQQQQQQQQAQGDAQDDEEDGEGKEEEELPYLQGQQVQGKGGKTQAHHTPDLQAPIAAGPGAKVAGLAVESSDSEGSLPDIDSGGEQDSSDDEDAEDDDMEG